MLGKTLEERSRKLVVIRQGVEVRSRAEPKLGEVWNGEKEVSRDGSHAHPITCHEVTQSESRRSVLHEVRLCATVEIDHVDRPGVPDSSRKHIELDSKEGQAISAISDVIAPTSDRSDIKLRGSPGQFDDVFKSHVVECLRKHGCDLAVRARRVEALSVRCC